MAKRTRKTKAKKTSRKGRTSKRKTTVKKKTGPRKKAAAVSNAKAYWAAYRSLQQRVDKAWEKLRENVKRAAPAHVLVRDKNQLMLLLGECNYMTRECMRIASQHKK